MSRPLQLDPLRQISARTLAHYRRFAEAYRAGTRDHDVSQNLAALLGVIDGTLAIWNSRLFWPPKKTGPAAGIAARRSGS